MNNPSAAAVPKVSVFMMTYNQAPYIKQALESILMQQTNFSVEIVIGEDCSTDGTRAIVRDYAERYPTRIQALLHETNVGACRNQRLVLTACTGQYIAVLEGDDYWTDPQKLQRQVDFLDNNPDYAICFHNGSIIAGDNPRPVSRLYETAPPDTGTLLDLTRGNYLSMLTCMYRNCFGPLAKERAPIPAWLDQASIGDYCLHLLVARYGKIKYLPFEMATYRTHPAGSWSMQNQINRSVKLLDSIQLVKNEFTGEVRAGLDEQQLHDLSVLAEEALNVPDFDFDRFLADRQPQIMELIAADFVPFMRRYFTQRQAARSAEYRTAVRLLRPVRWGVNWVRQRRR